MPSKDNARDPIVDRLDVLIRLSASQMLTTEPRLQDKLQRLEALGIVDRAEQAIICGTTQATIRKTSSRMKKAGASTPGTTIDAPEENEVA